MQDGQLFAVTEPEPEERPFDFSHFGRAAEHLAIAKLLELGHKVAVPVVDDDGVDLIVDYCVKVQVKASSQEIQGYRAFSIRNDRKQRYNVDVFLLFDRVSRAFYVVPASSATGYKVYLYPKNEVYREAWEEIERAKEARQPEAA